MSFFRAAKIAGCLLGALKTPGIRFPAYALLTFINIPARIAGPPYRKVYVSLLFSRAAVIVFVLCSLSKASIFS